MNAQVVAADAIVNALTDRRRGLFPGLGVRPAHPARVMGQPALPGRSQHRPHPRTARRSASVSATFFTLGWIAERYPATGPPHRRRRPRAREPRLRAPARDRAGLRRVPRRHPPRQGGARGHRRRARSTGYRAPSFSIGAGQLRGRSTASPKPAIATARASIRSATITTARPMRRAFAHEVRRDAARGAGHDGAHVELELAGRRRRLFPAAAVSRSRAGRSAASTPSTGSRRCSISIPGRSIPTQPRVKGPGAKTRFRHYLNLDRTEPRLRSLLADFHWDRVDRVFLNGGA